jgi:phage tail-like protein
MRKGFSPNGTWELVAGNGDIPDAGGPPPEGYLSAGAVPLGSLLPAVYQEYDENALLFMAGLDGVLAPVWLSIDCYDAYLSPAMSPHDMTAWLANWVGIVAADNWNPDGLARLVNRSHELYQWRGTVKGIADLIEAYTGLRPEIEDNGGVAVSPTRGGGVASGDRPAVVVRLPRQSLGADDATRDERLERLTALVNATTPAHVIARVELT